MPSPPSAVGQRKLLNPFTTMTELPANELPTRSRISLCRHVEVAAVGSKACPRMTSTALSHLFRLRRKRRDPGRKQRAPRFLPELQHMHDVLESWVYALHRLPRAQRTSVQSLMVSGMANIQLGMAKQLLSTAWPRSSTTSSAYLCHAFRAVVEMCPEANA